MKVAIYSHTPIAGAPWNQYQCMKRYLPNEEIRFIQQRVQYKDGREFPKDLVLTDRGASAWLKSADVVHIHNYLPTELKGYLRPKKQKIIATLHSVPRQGKWQDLLHYAQKTFTIRQPMQMREYVGFDTLPNMFDIWNYKADATKTYDGVINIVYCPTNKHANNVTSSKGYNTVMPLLVQIKKERGNEVNIISFSDVEYLENLKRKSLGHITIDDICGATFHLTSIEGCCTEQAVLTSVPKDWGYPFIYTTLSNLKEKIDYFLDNRDKLAYAANYSRSWLETNWNPKTMVSEYLTAYNS